ncbi:hypothetical protein K449DRAFT_392544 [Hypoxylon sp. EC38]|nr:hypothetical protein K449DRAFT_392544 [Hypoxylon sp. EC38]
MRNPVPSHRRMTKAYFPRLSHQRQRTLMLYLLLYPCVLRFQFASGQIICRTRSAGKYSKSPNNGTYTWEHGRHVTPGITECYFYQYNDIMTAIWARSLVGT